MLRDIRFGLRRLLRTPVFAISVVAILAGGVGAATTLGSVLYALTLRPLSLPTPHTLVAISTVDTDARPRNTPLLAIEHLRAAPLAATGWCAYNSTIDATESGGRVVQAYGELLSGDCLTVIGVSPAIGRWFSNAEAPLTGTGQPVVVITDRLWRRLFDGAPDVVGRTIRLQNISATVIGVMPAEYHGFSQDLAADFIIPFNAHRRSSGAIRFLGRLKPGASIEGLHDQVQPLWPSVLEAVLPASPTRTQSLAEWSGSAELIPGGFSTLRRLYGEAARQMTALALTLLLLASVNVGGLMIARVTGRAPEFASMRTLGASGLRIARPLLWEVGILVALGAALGVPLAYAMSAWFATLLPSGILPWSINTTPDPAVLAVVLAGAVIMTFAISALPVWLANRLPPVPYSSRTVARPAGRWLRAAQVVQIAMALVLVVLCGLIVQSFNGLRHVGRGYDRQQLLSLRLAANPDGYRGMDPAAYYPQLLARLATLPGVRSVASARYFGTINAQLPEEPIGFVGDVENAASGAMDFVSPRFFETIGAPLLRGRDVAWTDGASSQRVAIVSDSLARSLAPDGDVVGRVVRYGATEPYSRIQIVGVAGNISIGNVRQNAVRMIYVPSVQTGETAFATVHLRTAVPPMQLARAAADTVAAFGREHLLGAYSDVLFGNSMVQERMGAIVSSAGAVMALAISAVGLFALLSHSIAARTKEIGIRMAVGASPAGVARTVIGDALVLVAWGVAIGVPVAIGAAVSFPGH